MTKFEIEVSCIKGVLVGFGLGLHIKMWVGTQVLSN
jgi:hypothetical protein